jgi:tetratricopeptide (TPR) repeat protein
MRVWLTNDTAAAATLLRRSTDLLPSEPRRGELLWELAIALRVAGRSEESAAALAEAAAVAVKSSDAALQARVETERTRRSLLAGETGLADAVQRLEKTASVLRTLSDERGLGRALVALCSVHQLACNLGEVEAAAKEARRHYVASGFSPAACLALEGDALYFGSTPVADAEARCLELLTVAPDLTSRANLIAVLGALRAAGGRADDGRSLIADARSTLSELGSDLAVATAVAPLAVEVEVHAGDIESAIRIARENFHELLHGGHVAHASTRAVYLADLSLDIAAFEDANRFAADAKSTMIATDVLVQFLYRAVRARLLAHAGDVEGAATLVQEALEISGLTDAIPARIRAHLAAAEVFEAAGRRDDRRVELAQASRLARAKGIRAWGAGPRRREPPVELPLRGA